MADFKTMLARSRTLLDLLATDSDVLLRFDDGQTVPGHSQILRLWSSVLRHAIEAETSSSRPFSSSEPLTIPLPGTTKEQWLAAAAFMYPLFPRAAVSWDNLEAVLTIAAKYDCSTLLTEALAFIRTNADKLSLQDCSSARSAWRVIRLTNSLRLTDASKECIDLLARQPAAFASACKVDSNLDGLLPETLKHVVKTLASSIAPRHCKTTHQGPHSLFAAQASDGSQFWACT